MSFVFVPYSSALLFVGLSYCNISCVYDIVSTGRTSDKTAGEYSGLVDQYNNSPLHKLSAMMITCCMHTEKSQRSVLFFVILNRCYAFPCAEQG